MFEPTNIGLLEVPNRFIRSATAEFAANDDGTVIKDYYSLYTNLSKGEIGLIIQGHLYVTEEGKAHEKMAGISQVFHLEGLKQLVDGVHQTGTNSKIAAQLNHGGAYSTSAKGPSEREDKKIVVMTEEDIEKVINCFKDAAIRAKKVGYDAIQIHSAHGYLLSQFLSSRTNKRSDSYGGSLENRSQLLITIYKEIRSVLGTDLPILVKINGSDEPLDGFPVEEASQVAKWLAEDGLNAIEISGMKSTRTFNINEEAYFASNAQKIKKKIGDMPLSVVGGIRTLKKINQLHNEFADFISICRPFIREPDLVKKFRQGKEQADCITCNECLNKFNIFHCARI
jgi:2,4-dienoyl-CoA reductase-like NADH-dependent reductase (Old Yellow Enzyme family)